MTKFFLAAGAAALAIAAPVVAQGHGHGGQKAEHGNQGKGNDHAKGSMKIAQGHGNQAKQDHGDKAQGNRGHGNDRAVIRDRRADVVRVRGDDHVRIAVGDRGLIDGCPPGLAAKGNGCLPPGQAKKLVGTALPSIYARSMLEGPYRSWYRDDDRYLYRMGDNYIYRINRDNNLISALIPLVDRNFSYYPVGAMYPTDFNYYNVPYQYRSYYPDGGDYLYRYGDGAIYSLNPQTQAIQSIVALLAGDLGVGQRMPASYGVYNVPLAYRDRYYDSPTDWYRYNDGYIYRVDPTTQMVTAVIDALV